MQERAATTAVGRTGEAAPRPAAAPRVLFAAAGNAALQRFLSTEIGAARRSPFRHKAPAVPTPDLTPGAGAAGTATITLQQQGALAIPVEAFSMASSTRHDAATGQATGRPQDGPLSITHRSDAHSPALYQALTTNETVVSLKLDVTENDPAGGPPRQVTYELKAGRIADLEGSDGGAGQTEVVSFVGRQRSVSVSGGAPASTGRAGTADLEGVGHFDLHGLSWGATSHRETGSGMATGRATMQHVVLTKEVDEQSPALIGHLQRNQVIGKATLAMSSALPPKPGQRATSVGELVLRGAVVASVQTTADGQGRPLEVIELAYHEVEVDAGEAPVMPDAPATFAATSRKMGAIASPVLSWSWGIASPHDVATGQASGHRQLQPFEVVVPYGPATAKLFQSLAVNDVLDPFKLTPKSGPSYALGNVSVSDVHLQTDDARTPTATIKLVYQTVAELAAGREAVDSRLPVGGGHTHAPDPSAGGMTPGPGKAGTATFAFSRQGTAQSPVEDVTFGAASPRDTATGLAVGHVRQDELVIKRQSDGLSPAFLQAASTNELLSSVTVGLLQPAADGTGAVESVQATFTGATVSAFQQSGGSGAAMEEIHLRYQGSTLATTTGAAAAQGSAGTVACADLGPDAIPLRAAAWSTASHRDVATGQATGKRTEKALSLTKDVDASSPLLQHALDTNHPLGKTTVVLKSGSDGGPAGTLTMHAPTVASVRHHAGPDGRPQETFTLVFQDLDVATQQGQGAGVDAPAHASIVDTKQGKYDVPVLSFNWGVTQQRETGSAMATGRRQHHPFHLVVPMGAASTQLLHALDINSVLEKATIVPKSGASHELGGAAVTSYAFAVGEQGQPTVAVDLVYQRGEESAGGNVAVDDWQQHV